MIYAFIVEGFDWCSVLLQQGLVACKTRCTSISGQAPNLSIVTTLQRRHANWYVTSKVYPTTNLCRLLRSIIQKQKAFKSRLLALERNRSGAGNKFATLHREFGRVRPRKVLLYLSTHHSGDLFDLFDLTTTTCTNQKRLQQLRRDIEYSQ
jgi:hypothetical protein